MVDEKSDKSFWTSLPGILAGLAALITAIGSILWIIPWGGSPEIVSFEAHPDAITSGNSAELIWNVKNAESVSIDPEVGSTANAGTKSVSPKETTTYTLTAKNKDKVKQSLTQVVVHLTFDFLNPSLDGWERTGTSIPWKTLSDSVAWHETWGGATGVVVLDSCHRPSANIDTSCGIKKSIHIPSTATNLIANILKLKEDGAMIFKLIDPQGNEITLGTEYLVGSQQKTVSYSIRPWAGKDVTLKIMSFGWGGEPTPSCSADINACCVEYIGLDKVEIV